MRGTDGGKLVKGVKLFAVCDKHGSLLDLDLQSANTDDCAGVLPMLPRLTALGFQGDLLGDSGFKGVPFATAAAWCRDRASGSTGVDGIGAIPYNRSGAFALPFKL